MRMKLPVFVRHGLTWALVWWNPRSGWGQAVCEDGSRGEVHFLPSQVECLEVRAFRMVES